MVFKKGNVSWNKGKKASIETKKKQSLAKLGKSAGMLGKHHSEETKRKISLIQIGKKLSEEHKVKIGLGNMGKHIGETNFNWKGNNVGYFGVHRWIRKWKSRPELCEFCNKNKSYEVANINGIYNRDFSNYKWACRSCHEKRDKNLNKSVITNCIGVQNC